MLEMFSTLLSSSWAFKCNLRYDT